MDTPDLLARVQVALAEEKPVRKWTTAAHIRDRVYPHKSTPQRQVFRLALVHAALVILTERKRTDWRVHNGRVQFRTDIPQW